MRGRRLDEDVVARRAGDARIFAIEHPRIAFLFSARFFGDVRRGDPRVGGGPGDHSVGRSSPVLMTSVKHAVVGQRPCGSNQVMVGAFTHE